MGQEHSAPQGRPGTGKQPSLFGGGRKQGHAELQLPVCVLGGLFLEEWPLWLRHLYRPVSDTGRNNMAQKLHDKALSDGHEIFNKDEG